MQETSGSVRCQKLGFYDMDIAECAGAGLTCRRCLLEAYPHSQHRPDNSTLKIWLNVTLMSGDPLFKRPTRASSSFYAPLPVDMLPQQPDTDLNDEDSVPHLITNGLILSHSATKDSLVTSDVIAAAMPAVTPVQPATAATPPAGHSRSPSQQSKASVGYGSLPAHSRNGSDESESAKNRVDATRINPEDVIKELLDTNLPTSPADEDPTEEEEVGLQLIVNKDGTMTLASRHGTQERKPKARSRTSAQVRPDKQTL